MQIHLLVASPDAALIGRLDAGFAPPAYADIAWRSVHPDHLLRHLPAVKPDVLLLEHPLKGDGIGAIMGRLRGLVPDIRVLLLCDATTDEMIVRFIKLAASGCLLKSMEPWLVAKAVRGVHAGDVWFERSALLRALHSEVADPASEARVEEGLLTKREEEIFRLVGSALSNKEIARHLNISDNTVKTHLHRIYVKLNRSGRYKALLSQRRGGFSQVSP